MRDLTFSWTLGNIETQNRSSIELGIEEMSSFISDVETKLRMVLKICWCARMSNRWLLMSNKEYKTSTLSSFLKMRKRISLGRSSKCKCRWWELIFQCYANAFHRIIYIHISSFMFLDKWFSYWMEINVDLIEQQQRKKSAHIQSIMFIGECCCLVSVISVCFSLIVVICYSAHHQLFKTWFNCFETTSSCDCYIQSSGKLSTIRFLNCFFSQEETWSFSRKDFFDIISLYCKNLC